MNRNIKERVIRVGEYFANLAESSHVPADYTSQQQVRLKFRN